MKKSIEWFDCEGPATQQRIDLVSREIGVTFPKTFIALMKECDGGTPEITSFKYYNNVIDAVVGDSLGCFMGFEEKGCAQDHLLGHYRSEFNYLPKGVIAFAFNGGGDYICFDYRKGKKNLDPEVVCWDHEESEEESIFFVAKNFDAFMAMLHPFDESLLE